MSSSLILCNNNKPFLSWDCDLRWKVNCIQQPAMISSVVGLRSSKALPKAKLAPKKGHGHCLLLVVWSTAAFWIPVKPLYLRSMLSKSMKSPKTAAGIGKQKGPSSSPRQHLTKGRTTKVEGIGLQSFASSTIFTWPQPTNYYFFKHLDNFLQEIHIHNQQDAENAFQEFVGFWSIDFYTTGISTYF